MNIYKIIIESLIGILVAVSLYDILAKKHPKVPLSEIRFAIVGVLLLFIAYMGVTSHAGPLIYAGIPALGFVALAIVYVLKKKGRNPIR